MSKIIPEKYIFNIKFLLRMYCSLYDATIVNRDMLKIIDELMF